MGFDKNGLRAMFKKALGSAAREVVEFGTERLVFEVTVPEVPKDLVFEPQVVDRTRAGPPEGVAVPLFQSSSKVTAEQSVVDFAIEGLFLGVGAAVAGHLVTKALRAPRTKVVDEEEQEQRPTRASIIIEERRALGLLSKTRETGVWRDGGFSGRTAKDAVAGACGQGFKKCKTGAELLKEATRDLRQLNETRAAAGLEARDEVTFLRAWNAGRLGPYLDAGLVSVESPEDPEVARTLAAIDELLKDGKQREVRETPDGFAIDVTGLVGMSQRPLMIEISLELDGGRNGRGNGRRRER